MGEKVVIFDGDCLLCNKIANFLSEKDKNKCFAYISNTSDYGKQIILQNNWEEITQKTIIVKINDVFYTKSEAIYQFLRECGIYAFFRFCIWATPRFISDFIYDSIAKRRKTLVGLCPIPQK
ncbi:MAG: DCC1-like thiol-disulfide oxidoreductase family protein [Capnocytophaga sp.]|nr:DCC1-like thiol-disulfide oxidoreductase family protein [Capnocytophaga sp.]